MKEEEKESKGGQRLLRLLLVGLMFLMAVGLVRAISQSPLNSSSLVKLPSLSELNLKNNPLTSLIKTSGLVKNENNVEEIEESGTETKIDSVEPGEVAGEKVEPIAEPVSNVQNQANTLIELLKKLPEDQLTAIKKQLCKELCEE
ncbi:hypothetical protein ACFL0Y_02175 [Patescibacteria group bacterium]